MNQIRSLPSKKSVINRYRAFSALPRGIARSLSAAFSAKIEAFKELQRKSVDRYGIILEQYLLHGHKYHPSVPFDPPAYDKESARFYFEKGIEDDPVFSRAGASHVKPVYSVISRMKAHASAPTTLTDLESKVYRHLSPLEKRAWWIARPIDIGDLRKPQYEKRSFRRGLYGATWRTAKNSLERGGVDGGVYLPGTFPLVKPVVSGANVYAGGAKPRVSHRRYEDLTWYLLYAPRELQDGIWTPLQTIRRVSFIKLLIQSTSLKQFAEWLCFAPAACYLDNEYPNAEILMAIFDNIASTYTLLRSIEAASIAKVTNTSAFFSSAAYSNMLNTLVTNPAHELDHAGATVFDWSGKQVRLSLPTAVRDVLLQSFSKEKIQTVIKSNLDKLALSVAESHDPDKVYAPDEVEWGIYENPFIVFNPEASERVGKAVWTNISMPHSRSWQSSEHSVIGSSEQLEYMKSVPDIRERYARTTETKEGLKSARDLEGNRNAFPWIVAGIAAGAVASQI
jgi:hypothetical protein